MADIAVNIALFLVDKVLLNLDNLPLPKNLRDEVEELSDSLGMMKAYLKDLEGYKGSEVLRHRVKKVQSIAYDAEDVLDQIMLLVTYRYHRHKFTRKADEVAQSVVHLPALYELISKMKEIKRRIVNSTDLYRIFGSKSFITIPVEGSSSSPTSTEKHHRLVSPRAAAGDPDYEIVGFEHPTGKIIYQLKDTKLGKKTITLEGPCGSGKSTLARSVYQMTRDQGLFDCYAWVHVSSFPKFEEMLSSMLKQFFASRGEPIPHQSMGTWDDLRGYLLQKRYVVFLDDIWRREDYERITNALPNGFDGSKIVVTTRNSDVASFCSDLSHIHNLAGLSVQEAWQLFCKEAYQTHNCPPELEHWSQKIVKRCEGIPLAIVAVGTLLSKKPRLPKEWKRMHDNLVSEIGTDSRLSIINKLLVSYKDLPSNLKSCYLYFSVFPEDYSIDCGSLVRLWISEGFVMKSRAKTLEEVAEDYLNDLVGRNLVCAGTRDLNGRIRDCRVLNFVHDFIIQKSEEEDFVTILDMNSGEKARRLSIHNACTASTRGRDFSSVRSTLIFNTINLSPSEIENTLLSMKFLRVLDLRNAPLKKFPNIIFHLILLRYLCLRNTRINQVPKSMKKLRLLETLDLKHTNVTKLPKKINRLRNLRHLLVSCYNVKNQAKLDSVEGVELFEGIGALTSLQKLSLVKPDKHHKFIKELGALTQLRKLGIIKLKREAGKDLCASIQKMENLSTLNISSVSKEESLVLDHMHNPPPHLQCLDLKGHLQKLPRWISSLRDVLRIRLKWSRLESSPLEVLQELPNLIELEMIDAFIGEELVFRAGSFKKLKILHIDQFEHLHTVEIQESALSELQKLTLCNCVNLKMLLPLGINNLTCLEELHTSARPLSPTSIL